MTKTFKDLETIMKAAGDPVVMDEIARASHLVREAVMKAISLGPEEGIGPFPMLVALIGTAGGLAGSGNFDADFEEDALLEYMQTTFSVNMDIGKSEFEARKRSRN